MGAFEAILTTLIIMTLPISGQIVGETTESTSLTTYLYEEVNATYNYTGELLTPVNRSGHIDVIVPNTGDVLQQVELNLSSTTSTNLNNVLAYRNFVQSTTGAKQRIYVNTTSDSEAEIYQISDANLAPTINMSLSFNNSLGGVDLHSGDHVDDIDDGDNVIQFNLSLLNPSNSKNLTNVEAWVKFQLDANGNNDSANITSNTSVGGVTHYTNVTDSDGDGFFDSIYWKGDIQEGVVVNILFNATIREDVNYNASNTWIDLDYGSSSALYGNNTAVFTEKTIVQNFSRMDVTEGIDMAINTTTQTWMVRGYIENLANETTAYKINYTVHNWRLYEVATTANYTPKDTANLSYTGSDPWKVLAPGVREYTDWFDTGSTSKPFYAAHFDWTVDWEGTYYYSLINMSMKLPLLKEIDITTDKVVGDKIYAEIDDSIGNVNDTIQFAGNNSLQGEFVQILSYVPNTDNDGDDVLLRVNDSSIKMFFKNSSGEYELNQAIISNWTVTQPSVSSRGLINLTITNVSNISFTSGGTLGHYLNYDDNGVGERIKLYFNVVSNASAMYGDGFNFSGNGTVKTLSGTPVTETFPVKTLDISPMCSLNLNTNQNAVGPVYPHNTSEGLQLGAAIVGKVATPRRIIAYSNTSAAVTMNISINATGWACRLGDCLNPEDPGVLTFMPNSTTKYINSSTVQDNSSEIDTESEYYATSYALSSEEERIHTLAADSGASTWFNILIPVKTSAGVYQQNITYIWSCG
ncbi:MAG: hypothetical protein ACTSPB_04575 [Candidatus Thorarchaeota archaeon]